MKKKHPNPETPLTINDLECVGILPGLNGSIDVLYCLQTDKRFAPFVHVKIKAPGSEPDAAGGIRRLDGKELVRDSSNLDNLRVIGDDALQEARALMLALNIFHAKSEKFLAKMGLIQTGTGEIN